MAVSFASALRFAISFLMNYDLFSDSYLIPYFLRILSSGLRMDSAQRV